MSYLNRIIFPISRLDNGHINFEKFWQLAKQVTEFITWKQAACPYEKNANLVLFLLTTPVLNEKGQYNSTCISLQYFVVFFFDSQLMSFFFFFVFDHTALTLLSFEREPPDNSVEKEHYKTLKYVVIIKIIIIFFRFVKSNYNNIIRIPGWTECSRHTNAHFKLITLLRSTYILFMVDFFKLLRSIKRIKKTMFVMKSSFKTFYLPMKSAFLKT